jgi:hypothetical protein
MRGPPSVEPNALARYDGLDSLPEVLRLQVGMQPDAVDNDTTASSPGDTPADWYDLVVQTDALRVVPIVLVKIVEELPERRLIALNESRGERREGGWATARAT